MMCWPPMIAPISIHALLAESDYGALKHVHEEEISIHALLAESDLHKSLHRGRLLPFLSTLSLRRATVGAGQQGGLRDNFYPRSPCGERQSRGSDSIPKYRISIHALLAESDRPDYRPHLWKGSISIHALLAESDTPKGIYTIWACIFLSTLSLRRATRSRYSQHQHEQNFYPRSPCGERRTLPGHPGGFRRFLSTLSLRRATITEIPVGWWKMHFYPRSPCGERQQPAGNGMPDWFYFYPRSPCGERRNGHPDIHQRDAISIHALLAESDRSLH